MAGKGGAIPGAGRKPGIPNRASGEVRKIAQQFGPAAIRALAELGGLIKPKHGEKILVASSETARVAALNALLDRAYGKPTQPVENLGPDGKPMAPGGTTFVLQVER